MQPTENEIKAIWIKPSDLDLQWAKWEDHLRQSIFDSMRIPTPMQTFWIRGHHAIQNQNLHPGDHLDFCDSKGVVATVEIVQVRRCIPEPEIELLVPPSGELHLPAGLLVRSSLCAWVLQESIHIDNSNTVAMDHLAEPASSAYFTQTQQLPSPSMRAYSRPGSMAIMDPNSVFNRPRRKLFLEVVEANLSNWHRDGKQKALQAIAEEMVAAADMFVGGRNTTATAQAIQTRMNEIADFTKNNVPNWAYADLESGIKDLIEKIVHSVVHTGNTDHFHREYLGQWPDPEDDPSIHIANTSAMMKAAEEEERARKERRVERPDAPWKLDG